jgi:hypothetical protein
MEGVIEKLLDSFLHPTIQQWDIYRTEKVNFKRNM